MFTPSCISSWRKACPPLSLMAQCSPAGLIQADLFPQLPTLVSCFTWPSCPPVCPRERERDVDSWTLTAQPGYSGWLAKPHMPDFCNLFARPVFMSMLIVGSAVVQLYLLDFERLLFCSRCLASLWVCLKTQTFLNFIWFHFHLMICKISLKITLNISQK